MGSVQGQVSRGDLPSKTLQRFRPGTESPRMMQDSQDNTKKHLCHRATRQLALPSDCTGLYGARDRVSEKIPAAHETVSICIIKVRKFPRDSGKTEDGSVVCCEPGSGTDY